MMTIVIADDDILIHTSLNNILSQSPEWTILGTAMTGEEAVLLLKRHNPDVLIADIEMPEPNGIDLIQYIHKNDLKTKVLILSNHSKFEYVYFALQEGAIDYLLKDQLNASSLNLKLDKISNIIEKDISQQRFSLYHKQRFLIQCLSGEANEILEKQFIEGKEFTPGIHAVVRLQIIDFISLYEQGETFSQKIINVINSCLQNAGGGLCVYLNCCSFVLLFTVQDNISYAIAIKDLQKKMLLVESSLQKILDLETFYAYEIFEGDYSFIHKCNLHCIDHINQKLLSIDKEQIKTEKYVFPIHDELFIINAFCQSNAAVIPPFLDRIFLDAQSYGLDGVLLASLELYRLGHDYKAQSCSNVNQITMQPIRFPKVKGKPLIEEIKRFFISYYNQIISPSPEKDSFSYSPHIIEAINYIHLNYASPLSLDTLAKHLHLSSVYFSHLFKEEMGITFSNYLCLHRISVAKDLLKKTNYSIIDISEKIGFQNYNYFIQVFKKVVGTTPLKYRNS